MEKFSQKVGVFLKIVGIICEYNPLHLGHKKQLDMIRTTYGADCGIVCLMSGNFVQRGAPAIFDKSVRAKAAVKTGADLVLELPVTAALSSAEGFASQGVSILSGFCDALCFGAETANKDNLLSIANALLSPTFTDALRTQLNKGLSFPAARQSALEAMGLDAALLCAPNNILAVEYCKAIIQQGCNLEPIPILRQGSYHDDAPDPENPSATSLRKLIAEGGDWRSYVPKEASECYAAATLHTLSAGERAILGKLRTMTDCEFEALPYGSGGLWRKLMHASRTEATLTDILTATKSKRYTRTRLDRMVMCAFLGLTEKDFQAPAPYVRALAFNDKGRMILKKARETGCFPNAGERQEHPYQAIESRCGTLYGLFAEEAIEPASSEEKQRIGYINN